MKQMLNVNINKIMFYGDKHNFPEHMQNHQGNISLWFDHASLKSMLITSVHSLSRMLNGILNLDRLQWLPKPNRLHLFLIMTFLPNLAFTELRQVSMEHLKRVLHASRKRLPYRGPGSDLRMLWLLRPAFRTFHLVPNMNFIELREVAIDTEQFLNT